MLAESNTITACLETLCRDSNQQGRRRLLRWRQQRVRHSALDLDRAPHRMELLVTAFRNGRLEPLQFGHAELLVIASWYLHQQAPDEALAALLDAFRELEFDRAQAGGAVFSETKLTFWVLVVRRFLENEGSDGEWQKDAARILRFYGAARRLPYRYYSATRWKSPQARYQWLQPDLRPFPQTGRL